jgi:hypothetical protein
MPKILNQKEAEKKIEESYDKQFKLLSKYLNTNCSIKVKHLTCGNIYNFKSFKKFTSLKKNYSVPCTVCFKLNKNKKPRKKISLKEFKERIKLREDGNEYEYISDWVNYKTKCKVKHLTCGYIWEVKPEYLIIDKHYSSCPICSNKKRGKYLLKKNYLQKLLNKTKDGKNYQWLEEYKGNNKLKHKIKHLVCGNEFKIRPNDFQQGYRCNFCFKQNNGSKEENQIKRYIEKIYKGKITKYLFKKNNQELDIYLPDLKLAFEFNGLYWHSEKFKDKDYHYNKMVESYKQNIRLIQIWENEWTDLVKKKIIKSKIKYLLNQIKPEKRIFARKCYIKEISKEKCNNFLNNNHIQGKSSNYICQYGMFYKETKKLVAVMTFSKGLANRGSDDIELSRYTTKRFHNVIGGFSKMLSFAINENKWKEIYSYADLRLSDGNLYEANGWKRMGYVNPDYCYTDKSKKLVFHKSLFKKSNIKTKFPEIYDEKLTEREMMEKTKYLRIWDCGKIKYKYETIK